MPFYDYHCDSNGKTIEVGHSMSLTIKTWGELCDKAGHPVGDTPRDTPVTKLVGSGAAANAPGTLAKAERPRDFDSPTPMPMRTNKF